MSASPDLATVPGVRFVDMEPVAQAAPLTRPLATLSRKQEREGAQEPAHRIAFRAISEARRARLDAEWRIRQRLYKHWGAMRSMAPWFRRQQIALAMAAAKERGEW